MKEVEGLVEALRYGCVLHPKRWSGDTHDDLGGSIDEAATDALMAQAAAALGEGQAEVAALREDATFFRWLAVHPNLYTVADLLRTDQYVTLRRACESLVPVDADGGVA